MDGHTMFHKINRIKITDFIKMEEPSKIVTSGTFYKTFAGVLLAIVSFFALSIYNNMMSIQKELVEIKMQLTKIETSHYMTKLEVIEIMEKYISKYHKDCPN
jgi:cob(I)alamin adenosyltransferase